MKRIWMSIMFVLLMAAGAACYAQAKEQTREQAKEPRKPELTEEDKAALRQSQDLQKALKIARLELALAEAKEAPQREIAGKAESVYRLQGELHALLVKHPVVARHQWREGAGRQWRRGQGWGRGEGRGSAHEGMGRHGRRGMGRGGGMDHGMGMGRGRGMGQGMGMGQGRGMGRMMRMRQQALDETLAPQPTPVDEPPTEEMTK